MLVTVAFEATEPPTGHVLSALGETPFDGWLALLRLLEEATRGSSGRDGETDA